MAPLIDCVFLLLTYFLFTISLATIEGILASELALGDDLQESRLELEQEADEVIVRLIRTGETVQYFVDDWPVADFDAVAAHLSTLASDSLVVLDAGPTVEYSHVVRLYNHCLRSSIEQVVFPISGAFGTSGAPRL
jgi:biopolymer transport protein ExbD